MIYARRRRIRQHTWPTTAGRFFLQAHSTHIDSQPAAGQLNRMQSGRIHVHRPQALVKYDPLVYIHNAIPIFQANNISELVKNPRSSISLLPKHVLSAYNGKSLYYFEYFLIVVQIPFVCIFEEQILMYCSL